MSILRTLDTKHYNFKAWRCSLTCVSGCWSLDHLRWEALTVAGGYWSKGPGRWRWWPFGWSLGPAHTRWNSGWRKYCALPAMRNKEINKKAKAPLMRRSLQLDYKRLTRFSKPSRICWPFVQVLRENKSALEAVCPCCDIHVCVCRIIVRWRRIESSVKVNPLWIVMVLYKQHQHHNKANNNSLIWRLW